MTTARYPEDVENFADTVRRNEMAGFVPCKCVDITSGSITFEDRRRCILYGKEVVRGIEIDVYLRRTDRRAAELLKEEKRRHRRL